MTSASDTAKMMLATGAVDAWVKAAQVDAVLLYARQPVLPQKAALGEHVRLIAERGLVRHEPQRRCAGDRTLFEYRIRRTAKPFNAVGNGIVSGRVGVGGSSRHSFGGSGCSPAGEEVLELLAEAALADQPCPPEKAISAALGMPLKHVRKELAQLHAIGELVLDSRPGDYGLLRRVAILPRLGLATAMPVFMIPGAPGMGARV